MNLVVGYTILGAARGTDVTSNPGDPADPGPTKRAPDQTTPQLPPHPSSGGRAATGGLSSAPPTVQMQDLSCDRLILSAPRTLFKEVSVPSLGGIPLLAKLGQGGMGAVYFGIHPRLHREVAVKVLPFELAERNPDTVQRFFREGQLAARVTSPHLVAVLDVNEESGLFYIVMEYVNGKSGQGYLRQVIGTGVMGLEEAVALDLCIAVCTGLAAAHAKGIIHRDVKPDNMMIPRDDQTNELDIHAAKLADLGLARSDALDRTPMTQSGACMGTPGFAAPEQIGDAKTCSKPADVFSMGATLYALLTGRSPFASTVMFKILKATIDESHAPIGTVRTNISKPTADLIDRCLSKDPAQRYVDAAALLAALKICRAELSEPARVQLAIEPVSELLHAKKVGCPVHDPKLPISPSPRTLPQREPTTNAPPTKKSRTGLWAALLLLSAGVGVAGWHYAPFLSPAKQTEGVTRSNAQKPSASPQTENGILLRENFENNNLDNFGMRNKNAFSIVAQEGHGKVLQIGPAPHLDDPAWIEFPLNIERARGRLVEATVLARSTNPLMPGAAEFEIHWVVPKDKLSGAPMPIKPGSGDWNTFRVRQFIPPQATAVFIRIARRELAEFLLIDDLKVDYGDLAEAAKTPASDAAHPRDEKHVADFDILAEFKRKQHDAAAKVEAEHRARELNGENAEQNPANDVELTLAQADELGLTAQQKSKLEEMAKGPMSVLIDEQKTKAKEFLPTTNNGGPDRVAQALLDHADELGLAAYQLTIEQEIVKGPISVLTDGQKALFDKLAPAQDNLSLDVGNGIKMDLVLIKPGTFEMGSPGGEKERSENEKQHKVTISKAFYTAKFPVTQEQYEAVMHTNPSGFTKAEGGGPENPVEKVSWNDAVEFCEKLSTALKTKLPSGLKIQLPTEAQWEYACRAGTKTRFYTGDDEDDLVRAGWYTRNSDSKTHPVGKKTPNAYGLYDMHGNVYQWCQDAYKSDYETLPQKDPLNTQGADRVVRGGSWYVNSGLCRSAFRYGRSPDDRLFGFRVVVAPSTRIPP